MFLTSVLVGTLQDGYGEHLPLLLIKQTTNVDNDLSDVNSISLFVNYFIVLTFQETERTIEFISEDGDSRTQTISYHRELVRI